jgi:thioredoxin-like negative regulator of GroEL
MELQSYFSKGISYTAFREQVDTLFAAGKVTGHEQSERLLNFTHLNIQRMNRIDKTQQLNPALVQLVQQLPLQHWLVITEGWCGDSAQNLPVLNAIAAASNGHITLRIVSRDEHPELMNAYLTNGARAIPKLIMLDENGTGLAVWGPRPEPGQALLRHWKANQHSITHDDFERDLHAWYAKDKGKTLQEEIAAIAEGIQKAAAES